MRNTLLAAVALVGLASTAHARTISTPVDPSFDVGCQNLSAMIANAQSQHGPLPVYQEPSMTGRTMVVVQFYGSVIDGQTQVDADTRKLVRGAEQCEGVGRVVGGSLYHMRVSASITPQADGGFNIQAVVIDPRAIGE
jgi:hypothetical protein